MAYKDFMGLIASKAQPIYPAGPVGVLMRAEAAGRAAAEARVPVPMHVVERANPLDDSSPIVQRWAPVMGGVCGFAWVRVKGNSAIGNAARKRYGADAVAEVGVHKGWPSGLDIWVRGYGQSMEKKMAFAGAFAAVLSAAGHSAYADSRMD